MLPGYWNCLQNSTTQCISLTLHFWVQIWKLAWWFVIPWIWRKKEHTRLRRWFAYQICINYANEAKNVKLSMLRITISNYQQIQTPVCPPPPPKKFLFQNIWFLDVTNGYQHIFLRDDGNELGKGALYRIDFKSLHYCSLFDQSRQITLNITMVKVCWLLS